jgi:hypothetical protein
MLHSRIVSWTNIDFARKACPDKHSSLLRTLVFYDRKKFYYIYVHFTDIFLAFSQFDYDTFL